jgi:hypothetical protein
VFSLKAVLHSFFLHSVGFSEQKREQQPQPSPRGPPSGLSALQVGVYPPSGSVGSFMKTTGCRLLPELSMFRVFRWKQRQFQWGKDCIHGQKGLYFEC